MMNRKTKKDKIKKSVGFSGFSRVVHRQQEVAWETDIEELRNCPVTAKPRVYLTIEAVAKIKYLMATLENDEWAADLIGKKDHNGNYIVSDLYIFKQRVTATSVTREEGPPAGTIGCIHSHHSMGAFFSGIDARYANANHDLSGVVSSRTNPDNCLPFAIMFTARTTTACGRLIRFDDVDVELFVDPVVVDTDKIEKEAEDRFFYQYGRYFNPATYRWEYLEED